MLIHIPCIVRGWRLAMLFHQTHNFRFIVRQQAPESVGESAMKRFALATLWTLSAFALIPCQAGEGVFQKLGDGWRNGQWIPGFNIHIRPKTWQEVVFPVCWGSPQDCREPTKAKVGALPAPLYSVTYIVDCQDTSTSPPTPRGDQIITFYSAISYEDAKNKALQEINQPPDLCQRDPKYLDRSRTTVPGSGHFNDSEQEALAATVSMETWCHLVDNAGVSSKLHAKKKGGVSEFYANCIK
jgi:hypothetical protein